MGQSCSRVSRLAPHRYVFHSVWHLALSADRSFKILADVVNYPAWWPEFRAAELVGTDRAKFALRSALPITLHFVLEREVEDLESHRLCARVTGDIEGTVEWALYEETDQSTRVEFVQDVLLCHPIAAKLDWAIRPVLAWNHGVAMTSGAVGLNRYLASGSGRRSDTGEARGLRSRRRVDGSFGRLLPRRGRRG